ncbi:MAG: DMT family transporter, partial [Granulosicoccus sp.]|nr:DMT family transporter [Granulosicoccus sp.]
MLNVLGLHPERRGVQTLPNLFDYVNTVIPLSSSMTSTQRIIAYATPLVFVLMWSTGFIFTRMGVPYAEPLTFLCLRMMLAAALILVITFFVNVSWPTRKMDWVHSAVVGILIHGIYLGGVFVAIDLGLDTGITALIVGLQPLLTVAFAAIWLAERLSIQKLIGVLLGFVGITVIILHRGPEIDLTAKTGLWFCIAALLGISAGTLYQKKFCTRTDLLPATFIQYLANSLFLSVLVLNFESAQIEWTREFIFALTWLILVLSLGAVILLMWLIRTGEAGKVASLFYLVPP